MRFGPALLFATLLVASSSLNGQQTDVKTSLGGTMVNVPGSPVQLEGFTPSKTDLLDVVSIKNVSSKPVKAVSIRTILGTPPGCGIQGAPHTYDSGMRSIAMKPGLKGELHALGIDPRLEYLRAKQSQATFVHFQVGLEKVEFADGSTWSSPVAKSEFFSPELMHKSARTRCHLSEAMLVVPQEP